MLRPAPPALADGLADVVASLPLSLAPSRQGGNGDLAAIDGAGDWCPAAAAALRDGARGLVIDRPVLAPADALLQLADNASQTGASICVRSRFASHATLADVRADWSEQEAPVLIDCLASGGDGASYDPLLDQLLLVTRLIGPIERLHCDAANASGHMIRAQTVAGAVPVLLGWAADGLPPRVELRFLRRDSLDQAVIADTPLWAPIHALRAQASGEHHAPPSYESADRTVWRRLAAAVNAGAGDVTDLLELARLSRLVEAMTGKAR